MKAGVYVHLPFCKRLCHYCDFAKIKEDHELIERYQRLLLKEMELWFKNNPLIKVETLYFGGGSPSIYPLNYLQQLIDRLKGLTDFAPEEITLEANPWELDADKLKSWYRLGINRLSVGVQSASADILKNVGRESPSDLLKRLKAARSIFEILNLDFILGLPGESEKNLEENIGLIKELFPRHISYYFLDTDHDTPLMKNVRSGKIELPDVEMVEQLYDRVKLTLSALGYIRYEISSWQRDGMCCKHNMNYWKNGNYVGFGISAGGHVERNRYVNTENFKDYEDALSKGLLPRVYSVTNDDLQEDIETLFMSLRLVEGFSLENLSNSKYRFALVEALTEKLSDFAIIRNGRIRLNENGLDNSRLVFERILDIKEGIVDVFGT
ncbi:radical SAM family heme chaperone HemW [Kosmotoga arenicorallina]|nr:radical SAM family heme chaperone HemW [Kosmotoga arenicorallina]